MVGTENVRDNIPPAVLLETFTAALLVARNCLVHAFPGYSGKVTSSLAYKVLVQWPLTTAHTLAVFARRERPIYLVILTMLLTYALLALSAVMIWPQTTLMNGDDIARPNVVALVIVPLLILGPIAHVAWTRANQLGRRSMWRAVVSCLLSLAAFAVAVVLGVAMTAAWSATTAEIAAWMTQTMGMPLDTPAKQWLPTFALSAMVIFLMIVVPVIRGSIQRLPAVRSSRRNPRTRARNLVSTGWSRLAALPGRLPALRSRVAALRMPDVGAYLRRL
jgi:hypothetical protein